MFEREGFSKFLPLRHQAIPQKNKEALGWLFFMVALRLKNYAHLPTGKGCLESLFPGLFISSLKQGMSTVTHRKVPL